VSNERIANIIKEITGGKLRPSAGGIYEIIRKFSALIREDIEQIDQDVLNEKVVCTDGTNITVNGEQANIRNLSTAKSVRYIFMKKKNLDSMKESHILPGFSGTLIHDHETDLYHFGTRHGECNVHLLRYLTKNTEDTSHSWSEEIWNLLCQANRERRRRMIEGKMFSAEDLTLYEHEYDSLIEKRKIENALCTHKWASKSEQSLLSRLIKYRQNHQLFLSDFKVPFDNNLSERDLRKCKNRQKMSGGFRNDDGARMYCSIASFNDTCKRRHLPIHISITSILLGTHVLYSD
jgi:transposase